MDYFSKEIKNYSIPNVQYEHLLLGDKLGSGGTAKAFKCLLKGNPVVAKVFTEEKYSKKEYMFYDILLEITIEDKLKETNHCIHFLGYCIHEENNITKIYLLMEDLQCKDLYSYLQQDIYWDRLSYDEFNRTDSFTKLDHHENYWDYNLTNSHKLKIIKKLCEAVYELHSNNIVHCDLKCDNIIYNEKELKLIDYGASIDLGKDKFTSTEKGLGTSGYMSKELAEGLITYKGDIYSLGVCILEIWFGDIWPNPEDNDYKRNRKHVLRYASLLRQDNPELGKIVTNCINTEYTKRPLVKTILKHLSNLDHTQITSAQVV